MKDNIVLSVSSNRPQMTQNILNGDGITKTFVYNKRICLALKHCKVRMDSGAVVEVSSADWSEVKAFAEWCRRSDKILEVTTYVTASLFHRCALSTDQLIALTEDEGPARLQDFFVCAIKMAAERTDQIRKNEKCIIQQLELLEEDQRKMRDMEAQLLVKVGEVDGLRDRIAQLEEQLDSQKKQTDFFRTEMKKAEAALGLEYNDRTVYPIDNFWQHRAVNNKALHDARTQWWMRELL